MRISGALLILIFLAGCAGSIPENPNAKLGWGKAREITLANSESITYMIDPLIKQPSPLFEDAQRHCETYGKNAVPIPLTKNGVYQMAIFHCK